MNHVNLVPSAGALARAALAALVVALAPVSAAWGQSAIPPINSPCRASGVMFLHPALERDPLTRPMADYARRLFQDPFLETTSAMDLRMTTTMTRIIADLDDSNESRIQSVLTDSRMNPEQKSAVLDQLRHLRGLLSQARTEINATYLRLRPCTIPK